MTCQCAEGHDIVHTVANTARPDLLVFYAEDSSRRPSLPGKHPMKKSAVQMGIVRRAIRTPTCSQTNTLLVFCFLILSKILKIAISRLRSAWCLLKRRRGNTCADVPSSTISVFFQSPCFQEDGDKPRVP